MEESEINSCRSITARIADIGCRIFFAVVGVIFAATSVATVFTSCKVDLHSKIIDEKVLFLKDPIWLNILLLFIVAVMLVFCRRLRKRIAKIPVWAAACALAVYTALLSVLWIFSVSSVPGADSAIITNSAKLFAVGDYSPMFESWSYYGNNSYYQFFPFQLGYTALCEVVYRVFGVDNWAVLQIINVVALEAAFLGLLFLCHMLFKSRGLTVACTGMLALCFQGMLFTSFSYGNLLGLAFGVWAVNFTVMSLGAGKRKLFLIPAAVCMGISVTLKYNNMIILAALVVMLLVDILRRKKLFSAVCAVCLAAAAVLSGSAVTAFYEHRSGADIGGGVTQLLYADMGINESAMAPGWYNGIAMETYRDCGLDAEKANELAKADIRSRLKTFADDPIYMLEFYAGKYLSVWNEAEMESIWVSEVKGHYNNVGKMGTFVYETARDEINVFMALYQTVVYAGFSAAMFSMRKSRTTYALALPIAVFGGMLYHMIFEAKSQYILTYFIMMVPFAVYGLNKMFSAGGAFLRRREMKRRSCTNKQESEFSN